MALAASMALAAWRQSGGIDNLGRSGSTLPTRRNRSPRYVPETMDAAADAFRNGTRSRPQEDKELQAVLAEGCRAGWRRRVRFDKERWSLSRLWQRQGLLEGPFNVDAEEDRRRLGASPLRLSHRFRARGAPRPALRRTASPPLADSFLRAGFAALLQPPAKTKVGQKPDKIPQKPDKSRTNDLFIPSNVVRGRANTKA
eukprot:gene9238-biopygen2494